MKKMWVLIGSLFLGGTSSVNAAPAAPAKVDAADSSPEAAKAAGREASSEADKWAASVKSTQKAVPPAEEVPAETPAPAKDADKVPDAPKPAVPEQKAVEAPAAPKRSGLNEIKGKLLSKSYDPKAIRVVVAGGINVEFAYDQKTSFQSQGQVISLDNLGYDDELVVRYAGKELYALEVERLSKAQRPE